MITALETVSLDCDKISTGTAHRQPRRFILRGYFLIREIHDNISRGGENVLGV